LVLKEELLWATNPFPGTSEDPLPKAVSRTKWRRVRSPQQFRSTQRLPR
jgi:hypothetical protein